MAAALPRTTRAAILTELKQPLVLDEIELPESLAAGQVLVKLAYTGICGAQLNEIDGAKGPDAFLPHLLGHEGSGVVLAVGEGVTAVKPDDAVVLHWRKGRGIDARPAKYRWKGNVCNAGWVTTFNEYSVVSENRVTTIPADFNRELAPLFGCAVTTGLGVISRNAKLTVGESIVIIGAGGVGLNLVQAAALVTAHPIVAVDLYDEKLALAKSLGATHLINARKGDLRAQIVAALPGGQADCIIDCTGLPENIQLAYELLQPKGRAILVGVPKKGNNVSIYTLPLHFGKVLTGSEGGDTYPTADIPRYIRLHLEGKLRLSEFITDRYPFEEINTAIARIRAGQVQGRAVLGF